ncbi:MAG TPA: non-ribosomal peptide synthetase, partial [Candidatus Limnocylindrales bacterium]|nr:non-ribosomal peptide synthetase [Candidatus Limnocylindrales bacterium]
TSGLLNPDQPVSQLDLASTGEQQRLQHIGISTEDPLTARFVHDLVAEQAARTPQADAVRSGRQRLTYTQLDQRANSLAERLRGCGVDTDDVVAVMHHRSPELIVTLLAILKAGGAYLALEPEDPPGRNAALIEAARVRLVVTDAALRDRLPSGCPTLISDDISDDISAAAQAEPVPEKNPRSPDTLAYVSFTSGSTGEPRAVGVSHRAVSRLVRNPNWIDIRPEDVFLQLAPVAFDASTLEIWAPLANGCCLAIAPAGHVEIDELANTIRDERVSVLWLTAGLFHRMITTAPDAFAGVRHVVAGGDVISPQHLARLLTAHPHLIFTNGYGPTENTTFTTCWTSESAPSHGSVPIGRPITGSHVAVLDAALKPVPIGVCGELYAAGDGVARGYLHRAAATADRFIPDTFTGQPGGRMYRTGDLARWNADSTLEFLGRTDHQLKVQGFRVEPGHIEAELTALPEVRDAVVTAQPDGAGGKRLLAYVVPNGQEHSPNLGATLRERLRQTLPPYSVPWTILIRAELPLNDNGKVDRRALPAATHMPRNVDSPFAAARTAMEHRLAALWSDVLGIEPIGIDDDFFDLGGHSLLVAELLGTLEEHFGVDVPARVLYLQPTIAELAQEIEIQLADDEKGVDQ